MKIIIQIIIVIVFLFNMTKAQESIDKNAVSLEFLGNGFLYSLNFEKFIIEKERSELHSRIGISYLPTILTPSGPVFLAEVNNLIGGSKHKLEIGLGLNYALLMAQPENSNLIYGSFRLGYKNIDIEKRIFYRIGIVPVFKIAVIGQDTNFHNRVAPWFGIGLGKMF